MASNDKMMIQNWKWRVRKWPRPNLLFRLVSAGTKEKPVRIAGASAWMKTRHLPTLSRHRYTKLLVLTLLLRRHWVIILWLGENEETSRFANWVNESIDTQTPTHIGCNPHSVLPWRRGWVSGGVAVMVLLLQIDTVGAGEHLCFSWDVATSYTPTKWLTARPRISSMSPITAQWPRWSPMTLTGDVYLHWFRTVWKGKVELAKWTGITTKTQT